MKVGFFGAGWYFDLAGVEKRAHWFEAPNTLSECRRILLGPNRTPARVEIESLELHRQCRSCVRELEARGVRPL